MSDKDNTRLRFPGEHNRGNRDPKESEKDEQQEKNKRESGVFFSSQNSQSPDPQVEDQGAVGPAPGHRNSSGYSTGLSTSSVSTSVSDMEQTRTCRNRFYVGEGTEQEFQDCQDVGFMLDSGTHSQPVDTDDATDDALNSDEEYGAEDELELSGLSTNTLIAASAPIDIPVSHYDFHAAQGEALLLMAATPPRAYLGQTSSSAPVVTAGCMTAVSPVIQGIVADRRQMCDTTGCMLQQGFQVTSGRLHVSNSTADLHRTQTYCCGFGADADETEPAFSARNRSRSQSAPHITYSVIGEELKKMGDEFFSDFHQKVKNNQGQGRSRSQSQAFVHPMASSLQTRSGQHQPRSQHLSRSFPGSSRCQHSSWWWQAIVQKHRPPIVPTCDDQPSS